MDARGQFGRDAKAGTENFQDERIARADEFHAATQTNAQRLEALRVLVIGRHAPHDGADARRQLIKPHQRNGLFNSGHNVKKISLPPRKSISPPAPVDRFEPVNFLVFMR